MPRICPKTKPGKRAWFGGIRQVVLSSLLSLLVLLAGACGQGQESQGVPDSTYKTGNVPLNLAGGHEAADRKPPAPSDTKEITAEEAEKFALFLKDRWYQARRLYYGDNETALIQDTVNCYFLLKLEARKVSLDRIAPLNFAYLFDLSSPEGRETHQYEWGRLRHWVAWGPYDNTYYAWYQYSPLFLETKVAGDVAEVVVKPIHYFRYPLDKEPQDGAYVDHTITLVKKNGRWLIQKDTYDDEQMRLNPHGTDWDRLIQEIPAKITQP